tara:strand:+ start:99 stop:407 length:309 start_codon:yes stop_codon:yes gene_type:complete
VAEKINWTSSFHFWGERQYEWNGITYQQGREACPFYEGDLVLLASPGMHCETERIAGIVLEIKQPDPQDWPLVEVQWADARVEKYKSKDLWRVIDGAEQKDQ